MASLAFAFSFGVLLTIPYLGPLTCILAHAAAPLALVELMLDNTKKTDAPIPPPPLSFEELPLPSAPPAIEDEWQAVPAAAAVVGDDRTLHPRATKDKAS